MVIGQVKKFCFHLYWMPDSGEMQLRQIGNLRPPDELIERGFEIADEKLTKEHTEMSDSDPVYIGIIEVGFLHVAGEPEKNDMVDEYEFDEYTRVETGQTLVGDKVAGEFRQRRRDGSLANTTRAYQDKGWLTVNGEFYAPSDEKPDGWTS